LTVLGPRFDGWDFSPTVPADGYRWWYIDAESDDGAHALTVIAFIGSVFSPYYAWARRRRQGVPAEQHCAINVVLRGPHGNAWAMTERGAGALHRTRDALCIGRSDLHWRGDTLVLRLEERSFPWPARIKGEIRLYPQVRPQGWHALDAAGRHHWSPIAPLARIEVDLAAPAQRWSGPAYLDTNGGSEALEAGFAGWHWSRTRRADEASVLYDVTRRDGTSLGLALHVSANGRVEPFEPPPLRALGCSGWAIARYTRCDTDGEARIRRRLLDAPFYARAALTTRLRGEDVTGIHETLSLDRFASPWVQAMLAARMPRRSR
jgi:carotenoid 1,2-hydratase